MSWSYLPVIPLAVIPRRESDPSTASGAEAMLRSDAHTEITRLSAALSEGRPVAATRATGATSCGRGRCRSRAAGPASPRPSSGRAASDGAASRARTTSAEALGRSRRTAPTPSCRAGLSSSRRRRGDIAISPRCADIAPCTQKSQPIDGTAYRTRETSREALHHVRRDGINPELPGRSLLAQAAAGRRRSRPTARRRCPPPP